LQSCGSARGSAKLVFYRASDPGRYGAVVVGAAAHFVEHIGREAHGDHLGEPGRASTRWALRRLVLGPRVELVFFLARVVVIGASTELRVSSSAA
jgi:hypothetical protein